MSNIRSLPYIPIPRLKAGYSLVNRWYCRSEEYCTWDGKLGFYCSGHGGTPIEAYEDWLEEYKANRYYEEEE